MAADNTGKTVAPKADTTKPDVEKVEEVEKPIPTSKRQKEMRQNANISIEELNKEFGEPCEGFEWKWIPSKDVKKHGQPVTIPAQWVKQRKPLTEEEKKAAGERLKQHKKTDQHISYSKNLKQVWFYVKFLPDSLEGLSNKKIRDYEARIKDLKEYMRTEVYCIKKNLMIAAQRAEAADKNSQEGTPESD